MIMYKCECDSLRSDCKDYDLENVLVSEWEQLRFSRSDEERLLDFIISKQCYNKDTDVIVAESEHLYTVQSKNPEIDEEFRHLLSILRGVEFL